MRVRSLLDQHRNNIGNHVNWQDTRSGAQRRQDDYIKKLAEKPGRHSKNAARQDLCDTALAIVTGLCWTKNYDVLPAITHERAENLTKENNLRTLSQIHSLSNSANSVQSKNALQYASPANRPDNQNHILTGFTPPVLNAYERPRSLAAGSSVTQGKKRRKRQNSQLNDARDSAKTAFLESGQPLVTASEVNLLNRVHANSRTAIITEENNVMSHVQKASASGSSAVNTDELAKNSPFAQSGNTQSSHNIELQPGPSASLSAVTRDESLKEGNLLLHTEEKEGRQSEQDDAKDTGVSSAKKETNQPYAITCNSGEVYSPNRWQWASWRVCIDHSDLENLLSTYEITDMQYYWGSKWYRWYKSETSDGHNSNGLSISDISTLWNDWRRIDTLSGPYMKNTITSKTPIAATYDATLLFNIRMFWNNDPQSFVTCNDCKVTFRVPRDYNKEKNYLDKVIAGSHTPSIFRFSHDHRLPLQYSDRPGDNAVMNGDIYLAYIPNALKKVEPQLFGDSHTGISERCELNPTAATIDKTQQTAEIVNSRDAYLWLQKPVIWLNTNYFDVRTQKGGREWQSSQCSSPLGMYFDNNSNGPTNGTHNSPDIFFGGLPYFIDNEGNEAPVDTLFIANNAQENNFFSIIKNRDIDSNEAIVEAERRLAQGDHFVAVSGASLLKRSTLKSTPDNPAAATTRIGVGYDAAKDTLYILNGGAYRNGLRREDLAAAFRSLGVDDAIEFDGGGSAALGVDTSYVQSVGAPLSASSCKDLPSYVWCSPVTQPSGEARPVPSWMGFKNTYN